MLSLLRSSSISYFSPNNPSITRGLAGSNRWIESRLIPTVAGCVPATEYPRYHGSLSVDFRPVKTEARSWILFHDLGYIDSTRWFNLFKCGGISEMNKKLCFGCEILIFVYNRSLRGRDGSFSSLFSSWDWIYNWRWKVSLAIWVSRMWKHRYFPLRDILSFRLC